MKITPTALNNPTTGAVAGTRADGAGSANPPSSSSAAAGGKPTVDLSSAARHLSSLENTDSDINVARVQELRDAIASGQLKIDPSRIADGLLASVRDLLK